MNNLIGKDLGRYHILEKLGEGGMAAVYLAQDTNLDRPVAVKVILSNRIPPDELPRLLERFKREARNQARLSDDSAIVTVHDYGEFDGTPYLVMAYMPGGTLKDRLGEPIDCRAAARMLIPITEALAAAHHKGIIHRDVKPSNLLVNARGNLALADFGIAKALETSESTLTGTGLGVGTAAYMAPEQWRGEATAQSDIYSLGVVYYEMITGRKPYDAPTPSDVFLKQMTEPLPDPRQYASTLPEEAVALLKKALAKTPQDRFPDMKTFTIALEALAAAPGQKQPRPTIAPTPREAAPKPDPNATWDELADPSAQQAQQARAGNQRKAEPGNLQKKEQRKSKPVLMVVTVLALVGLFMWSVSQMLDGGMPTAEPEPAQEAIAKVPAMEKTAEEPTEEPTTEMIVEEEAAVENAKKGDLQVRPGDKMEMVYVPAGDFIMGSEDGDSNANDDEFPQTTIYLDAFWIDKYEVTNTQYRMCVEDGKCDLPNDTGNYDDGQYADHPVVSVSWYDARDYCAWAGGRLPSEAEWEKAASGTDGRTYPWGEESPSTNLLNYNNNEDDTVAVGSYPAGSSPYGALDMAGNVWEWTSSLYQDYPYDPEDGREDPDASGSRVMRGGSWLNHERDVRAAYRRWLNPVDTTHLYYGFRCVASHSDTP